MVPACAFRILPPSSHCWEVNSKQQVLWKILMTSWNDKLWHFRWAALILAQGSRFEWHVEMLDLQRKSSNGNFEWQVGKGAAQPL